jgi:transcriptional regulator with XRE-family HTH domain
MKYPAALFRAARAALRLETREVAAEIRASLRTIAEIEHADRGGARQPSDAAAARLIEFYEQRGVTFLANSAQGPGIRLKLK